MGRKASPKQRAAGRHNIKKAHVTRVGKRGMKYKKKVPL